jgi:hypothetical protein
MKRSGISWPIPRRFQTAYHGFVNWPVCSPNSFSDSALSGQTSLTVSSGAKTARTKSFAFIGSGSATTNGARKGLPLPSRCVVTTTRYPAVGAKPVIVMNMRLRNKAASPTALIAPAVLYCLT